MPIVIKGVAERKLYPKKNTPDDSGFKIYSINPLESSEQLKLNSYKNIVIKGVLPELFIGNEYEFEAEFESKNSRESYNVTKMLTQTKPKTLNDAMYFLCTVTSEQRASAILTAYPNFIEIIESKKYDQLNTDKIKGVGDKTLNKILQKAEEEYSFYDVMATTKEYNLSPAQVKKLIKFYETDEKVRIALEKNPYECLCSVSGIGFKTADVKILMKNKSFTNSVYRMTECLLYVLNKNEQNGNTYITSEELFAECYELTPECMEEWYDDALLNEKLFYHSDDYTRVAKMSTFLCEQRISDNIKKRLQISSKIYKNGIALTEQTISDEYKKVGNINLTDQQNMTIPALLSNNVVILGGYAGAGKSASCNAVVRYASDNGISFMLLAPTGRASAVLSDYTKKNAMTIHRALGAVGDYKFEYDDDHQINTDLVIVDESSMIDVHLLDALLRALPITTKILFVCDPAQIPSVGAGNVLQDMIRSNKIPVVLLDKVFRYNEGGLSYVATQVRNGKKYLTSEVVQSFGDNSDYKFIDVQDEEVIETALNQYMLLFNSGVSPLDICIVSSQKIRGYGTLELNNRIQKIVNPKKANEKTVSYIKNGIEIEFHKNDQIMNMVNNYSMQIYDATFNPIEEKYCNIFNGDTGKIIKITDDGSIYCNFDNNIVMYSKDNINTLSLGYSVTCHKMQGDSRKHIILVTPSAHTFTLNRNLIYVALTRATDNIVHIGNRRTVNIALSKSANLQRKTFLQNLLEKN